MTQPRVVPDPPEIDQELQDLLDRETMDAQAVQLQALTVHLQRRVQSLVAENLDLRRRHREGES